MTQSMMKIVSFRKFAALSGLLILMAIAGPLVTMSVAQRAGEGPSLDVHFVPTPQPVVDKMLELAKVKKDDYIIDLGSGDGRIPITAAKKFGAHGMGVDLDPRRIQEANENAKREKVTDKVEFKQQNIYETDLSKANVITMYLLSSINLKMRPRILAEAKPGTRVVSHSFDMGDWKPDKVEKVDGKTVYMWTVPEAKERRADTGAAAGAK